MSIEFPLAKKQTPFGRISDPKIPVGVRTLAGYRTFRFLIDTGADMSLAPRRLAQQVGLDWGALPEVHVIGVEQAGVVARLGHLPIRIGEVELSARCLFMDTTKTPFILGRADFLDHFVLTIDHGLQRIILARIPSAGTGG